LYIAFQLIITGWWCRGCRGVEYWFTFSADEDGETASESRLTGK